MKNFLFQKINKDFLNYFLISLLTIILTLFILGILTWNFRGQIFNFFAEEYIKNIEENLAQNSNTESVENNNILPLLVNNENASSIKTELSITDIVKKVNPSVVSIVIYQQVPTYEVYTAPNQNPFGDLFPNFFFNIPQYRQNGTERKQIGGGSGFFVSSDGLIVTNKHVVASDDAEYEVLTDQGKKYTATVIARDPVLDIALIKVSGSNFTPLSLGDSDSLQLGQGVIAVGNALAEFNNSVSVGIISGLSRSIIAGDGNGKTEFLDKVIQTDAAINPGNSGGPLLDMNGKVIGVNVAVAQGSQNIGFALPINTIRSVIESVKNTGKIIRPYLGIRYVQINKDIKTKNNLSVDYGILVTGNNGQVAVLPNSPAAKAGILENDIILEIDGVRIDETNNFASIIRSKKVGQSISLRILSKGFEKTIKVVLEEAKD